MKQCGICKETKPLDEFQRRSRNKDGYTHMCKPCKRAYDNNHYKNNPNRRNYIRANSDARIAEVRKWIGNYLLDHPCVDCGETELVVLEFDHRENKEHEISSMVRNGNILSVQREVDKCDVRCANCHRRKTARDFGYWKVMI